MGNTQCNTCFDRLGHGRPSGPLIRARRGHHVDVPESDVSEVVFSGDDSYVNSTHPNIDMNSSKSSDRAGRRRPSVSAAALRRQQASHAETEEEEYSEEEEEESEEDDHSTKTLLQKKVKELRKPLTQTVKLTGALGQKTSVTLTLNKQGTAVEWHTKGKNKKILGSFPVTAIFKMSVSPKNSLQLDVVVHTPTAVDNYSFLFDKTSVCADWEKNVKALQQVLKMA